MRRMAHQISGCMPALPRFAVTEQKKAVVCMTRWWHHAVLAPPAQSSTAYPAEYPTVDCFTFLFTRATPFLPAGCCRPEAPRGAARRAGVSSRVESCVGRRGGSGVVWATPNAVSGRCHYNCCAVRSYIATYSRGRDGDWWSCLEMMDDEQG
ncbi:hypothetical protein BKA80DRAFT_135083 [Phyllosticta citrichinensis]